MVRHIKGGHGGGGRTGLQVLSHEQSQEQPDSVFTVQEEAGKQQVCTGHVLLRNSQKANNSFIVISTVNRKVAIK